MRAPFTTRSLALVLLLVLGSALAQGGGAVRAFERGATVYVEVAALARALGVVTQADRNVLTWRGPDGPVTLFADSADTLVHFPGDAGPTDVALAAPVLVPEGEWFVPLDALPLFGIQVPLFQVRPAGLATAAGQELTLEYLAGPPGTGEAPAEEPYPAVGESNGGHTPGTTGRASWEALEAPLAGVRFFDGDGVSLLLADLALVPLAAPALTGEVDGAMDKAREAGNDHVLLLMVNAVADLTWSPLLVFEQDGNRMEVRSPYRMLIEAGEEGLVSPSQPVLGAVLLPPSFSLYRDMAVEWAGSRAVVRFRK